MNMKSFKARILRTLKSLPHAVAIGVPPAPAKPAGGGRVLHVDASDDSFFDACDAPKQQLPDPKPEPIDAWELVPPSATGDPVGEDDRLTCPLQEFPAKCPPGGEEAIILYTTTLRGIRKTFEDCNRVRSLLENLKVVFHERDVSMDLGFREELWRVLDEKVVPPRLFIRGRYVGGAEEVVGMHEEGRLVPLLRPGPRRAAKAAKCQGCGGLRFAVCGECNGSRKVFDGERSARCRSCNENGLVVCPLCS